MSPHAAHLGFVNIVDKMSGWRQVKHSSVSDAEEGGIPTAKDGDPINSVMEFKQNEGQ